MKNQKKLKQLKNALKILEESEVHKELMQTYSNQYITEAVEALALFIEELEPYTDSHGI
jgi:hypothetical protein